MRWESAIIEKDYYSLDKKYLSDFLPQSEWKLPSVFSSRELAFLCLRSMIHFRLFEDPLRLDSLSIPWKKNLVRWNVLANNPTLITLDSLPSLIKEEEPWGWKMEKCLPNNCYFLIHFDLDENLSSVLTKTLKKLQTNYNVSRAFVRKRNASYLYLQAEEKGNPRIFYREEEGKSLPNFLFLHFDISQLTP